VLVYQGLPYTDLWSQRGFLALWTVQRISLLLLQCSAAHATAMAFKDADQGWLSAAALNLMTSARRL
jgi:hypothetical protein